MHLRACLPLALLCLSGCSLDFDVDYGIPEQTVMGNALAHASGTLLDGGPLNPFELHIDLASETRSRGTGTASAVLIKRVHLAITSGEGDCFDFIGTATLTIAST